MGNMSRHFKNTSRWLFALAIISIFFQNCEQSGQVAVNPVESAASGDQAPQIGVPVADNTSPDSNVQINDPTHSGSNGGGGTTPAPQPPETAPNPGTGGGGGSGGTDQGSTNPPGVLPSLKLVANPEVVLEGAKSTLTVTAVGLDQITYSCKDIASGQTVISGSLSATQNSVSVVVQKDLICTTVGKNSEQVSLEPFVSTVGIEVNCANRLKAGGSCRDFSCLSVKEITLNNLNDIPARTSEGVCYALKLLSAVSHGPSTLTKLTDKDVISRDHDLGSNPTTVRNPYVLGSFKGEIKLAGPRVVKLSGGQSAKAPILVDNFIITGVYPTGASVVNYSDYYRVRGTSDSSIADTTGKNTSSVSFFKQLLPIEAFASSGTSSIAPIDITKTVEPNQFYTLDIRALDCGGSRELSEIYILFQ